MTFPFATESGSFIQTGRNLSEPKRPLRDFPWSFRSILIPPHNDKCCRLIELMGETNLGANAECRGA